MKKEKVISIRQRDKDVVSIILALQLVYTIVITIAYCIK